MGLITNTGWRVSCDHDGCPAVCPDGRAEVTWFHGPTARSDAGEVAVGSDWVVLGGRWLCPNHWTIDDDDETVEVSGDDAVRQSTNTRVSVDPVVVTCAVRYALGRSSYMPGLIADEVRRCWDGLGDQREVIVEDVRRWLADQPRLSDGSAMAWTAEVDAWTILHRWMVER